MATVLLALFPAAVLSVVLFGFRAFMIILVANLACGLLEYGWCRLTKNKNTVPDLSCFVTGTLLALTLPANFGEWKNLWMILVGAVIAIIIVKEFFGGIGYNFANPAITARIAMLVCFPDLMTETVHTNFTVPELASGATPLGDIAAGKAELLPDWIQMFFGNHAGAIGEVNDIRSVLQKDSEFHRKLMSVAGNEVLGAFARLIEMFFCIDPEFLLNHKVELKDNAEVAKEHLMIVRALRNKNFDLARGLMRHHLQKWDRK
jgi:hypothetical protein